MFALVRIHVPSTVRDSEGRVITRVNPEHVWEYVVQNHKSWHSDDLRILYMTRRHLQEDTSLIIDVKDPDVLSDFLVKNIAKLRHVRGIWVINMAKMRFFKMPADRPTDFSRFTLRIDARPQHLDKIYDVISAFEPGRDVMVNYIAQTFQSYWSSIMVSVLARSRKHLEAFSDAHIRPIAGVLDVDITDISKTMRLVSPEEWEESVGPFFVTPGGKHFKDIDIFDDSLMTGGC